MLSVNNAISSLDKLVENTTLESEEGFECYRAVKEVLNAYDDLRICLEKNGIDEQCILEHRLYISRNMGVANEKRN